MSAPPGFAQRVAGYSDVQLAEVIASASDYTPEAIEVVMAEWDRRKLTAEVVAPALAFVRERKEMQAAPNPTRPQAWKGIGFICYGREFTPSIGCITTQWFCFFFLPIVPIRSFFIDKDSMGAGGVASGVTLCLRQVVRTYAFVIFAVAFTLAGLSFALKLSDDNREFAAFGVMGISVLAPIFFLQVLRRNARRQRPDQPPQPTWADGPRSRAETLGKK